MALTLKPTTFDPARVQDPEMIGLLSNVFEGLVAYDEHNRIVPQLAQSWKVENGGRTYVFKLRKGAKFQNGRPVTAADVKWSIERNSSKALASPTLGYLSDIVGVSEHNQGQRPDVPGVVVVDPGTVSITIDSPRAYFLGTLTYPVAAVEPKELVPATAELSDIKAVVGTGPFKLDSFQADQQIVLAANSDYYLGSPKLRAIQYQIIQDAATRLNKFRAGGIDYLTLERQDIPAVQSDPSLKKQLQFENRPMVYYLGLNPAQYAPFRDVHVRRAIALAIDRTRLDRDLLGGVPEARGLIPPGVIGYDAGYQGLAFDTAAARQELQKAGYADGKSLPPLTFTYREQTPDARIIAEAVGSDLTRNLGMKVDLRAEELKIFLNHRNANQLEFYFLSWTADYLDPQNFLSLLLTSGSPQNHDSFSNPQFDKLCDEGDKALDEARRASLYGQANDVAVQQVARIPLYYGREVDLVSPRLSGMKESLIGLLPFRWAEAK